MTTSVSSAQNVLTCQRMYYLRNVLGYSSRREGDNLKIGNWGHYALHLVAMGMSYYNAVKLALDRQEELDQKYGTETPEELPGLFTNLLTAHEMWQESTPNRYSDPNLEYLHTEQSFTFAYEGWEFKGQWDGIVRHRVSGEVLVLERKFTSMTEQIDKMVYWDIQPRLYVEAARQVLGVPITGCLYEIIKICDPFNIKLLKNGTPSKAKDQLDSTTLDAYIQAITDAGADVRDYQEQIEHIKRNNNPIFRRKLVDISEGMRDSAMDALLIAAEMQDSISRQPGPPAPTGLYRYGSCDRCPFQQVCRSIDDDFGWEQQLQTMFIQGKEYFDE